MQAQDTTNNNIAVTVRALLLFFLVVLILFLGRTLFIPMFYGLFIAIVLYPVCRKLETHKLSKGLSITIALSMVIVLFSALLILLYWQIGLFRQDLPALMQKVKPMLTRFREWLTASFAISPLMQTEWTHNLVVNSSASVGGLLRSTVAATAGTFFSLFLIPIFAALFLYHRTIFVKFLYHYLGERMRDRVNVILKEVIHTYFNYIKGMILVYIIVGILNSIGLMALGIKHAILFGMLTAIMTIIPYAGIIISAALPISVAFITTNSIWYPIGVILVFSFVQYLEANVIFPKVVGIQLNVSTWAMLVAILAGGIIWGVSGMILFIPFVAILKIVASHIKELEALHILLNRDGH